MSDYEKFIYLAKKLNGEPLALVTSLQGVEESYNEAKNLLYKAFASHTRQKQEVIARLLKLKLQKNNEIYSYISEYRLIVKSFSKLKIEIDDIIRYFLRGSRPKALQNQFLPISNKNNPSLNEIDKLF